MEKEFAPYELALKLKVLGFDEPCFGYYVDGELRGINLGIEELGGVEPYYQRFGFHTLSNHNIDNQNKIVVTAPTFSQTFRWFSENHNLHAEQYTVDMGAIEYSFQIRDLYSEKYIYDNFVGAGGSYHGTFDTPEEVELKCLEKLIDIVSQQNIK